MICENRFIIALVEDLPPAGSVFTEESRAAWLGLMSKAFEFAYLKGGDSEEPKQPEEPKEPPRARNHACKYWIFKAVYRFAGEPLEDLATLAPADGLRERSVINAGMRLFDEGVFRTDGTGFAINPKSPKARKIALHLKLDLTKPPTLI